MGSKIFMAKMQRMGSSEETRNDSHECLLMDEIGMNVELLSLTSQNPEETKNIPEVAQTHKNWFGILS